MAVIGLALFFQTKGFREEIKKEGLKSCNDIYVYKIQNTLGFLWA